MFGCRAGELFLLRLQMSEFKNSSLAYFPEGSIQGLRAKINTFNFLRKGGCFSPQRSTVTEFVVFLAEVRLDNPTRGLLNGKNIAL